MLCFQVRNEESGLLHESARKLVESQTIAAQATADAAKQLAQVTSSCWLFISFVHTSSIFISPFALTLLKKIVFFFANEFFRSLIACTFHISMIYLILVFFMMIYSVKI